MTGDLTWPALAGVLFVLQFVATLSAYCLRNFSYTRLDEISRARGGEARFGEILKLYDDALLATEGLSIIARFGLVLALTIWLGLWPEGLEGVLAWGEWAGRVILVVMVLVLFAAILPWSISRVAGERFLYRTWPLNRWLVRFTWPVLAVAHQIDSWLHRLTGVEEPDEDDLSSLAEEIRTVVDEGHHEGAIESGARTMIHRVIELQDEDVAAAMTPRTDMVTLPVTASLEDARLKLLECGHSRVPVIGESIDEVIGILYAKDLLRHLGASPETNGHAVTLKDIVRETFYVPETTTIDTLLETMKRDRVHFAIVVDEFGGVAGIVTLEDVLEEIVGDITDEYDPAEEQGIRPLEPGITEVDAWVHIDDLNEQLGYNFPESDDYDTIGGFVFSQAGRVPEPNETVTWNNLRITVLNADERKLHTLRIETDKALEPASAEG